MTKANLNENQEERVHELVNDSTFIDALCGNIINPEPPIIEDKSYIDRLLESGITAQSITLANPQAGFDGVLKEIYSYYNLFDFYPQKIMQINSVSDIKKAQKEGKIGVIFNLQNSISVEKDFYKWSILSKLGLRICQLTYNEPNIFGYGCMSEIDNGLTFYGKQAIREMNRQKIVIDLSHVGEKTSLEAIEHSKNPCVFSHSNAKNVTPTTDRNITDEMMIELTKKGGVIGLSSHAFLSHKKVGKQPDLDDYMRHFD